VLVEDVSPAPSPEYNDGIIGSVLETAAAITPHIYGLVGIESEKYIPDRPRRPSAFVEELRRKIDKVHDNQSGGEESKTQTNAFPPLKVNLSVPQLESPTLKSFAEALERGFQSQQAMSTTNDPTIQIGTADRTTKSYDNVSANKMCDEFQVTIQSAPKNFPNGYQRELKYPEIILLMGCSRATIPEGQLFRVEVGSNSDVIMRTSLSADQTKEIQQHLEENIPRTLSEILFVPLSENNQGHRVERLSVQLIDESPSSHHVHASGANGFGDGNSFTAKDHFDILGTALSSSIQSRVDSLLDDLSFIYGGNAIEVNHDGPRMMEGSMIKSKRAIGVEARSTGYLALPEGIVVIPELENSHKHVSVEDMAKWTKISRQWTRNSGDVEWTLFVPSRDNSQLMVEDKSTGTKGLSVILPIPEKNGGGVDSVSHRGLSIINLPPASADIELDKLLSTYRYEISQSLGYLVGYIRSIHGLTPSTAQKKHADDTSVKYGDETDKLSFWELESVARSRYYTILDLVFSETDVLMALLHQHGGTLSFPQEVSYKLNNATYLLRESISLVEKGFPIMYASSLLHGSLQYIQSVQSDHRFVELPYFAPDHYLAVFSPLVLPLLLPMIVGVIREVKRFRELQSKKG